VGGGASVQSCTLDGGALARLVDRTGSVEAKPGTGHNRSPLKAHEQWLLDLVAQEPDQTLEEIRDRLRGEKKLAVAVSSVWRFYDRHEITFKKSPARGRAGST
jgi:transposase